jgi:hypothetical protein
MRRCNLYCGATQVVPGNRATIEGYKADLDNQARPTTITMPAMIVSTSRKLR